jgi:hypothetical protein
MTLMVINKDVSATAATINLVNVVHRGSAQVWQLTAANAIKRLPDVGQRQQLRRHAPAAEHHAVRRARGRPGPYRTGQSESHPGLEKGR